MNRLSNQRVLGAHLVGSLPAPDAAVALQTAVCVLGSHLYAVPGETGDRRHGVLSQLPVLAGSPGIALAGDRGVPSATKPRDHRLPALAVDRSLTKLSPGSLGYARAAKASYARFRALRTAGRVPYGVRLQVNLPTPYTTTVLLVREADQARFLRLYADAMAAELTEIALTLPADDVLIQWDVAAEIGALTGQLPAAVELLDKHAVLDALAAALMRTPEDLDLGAHLCHSPRPGEPFTVPTDLSLAVELAQVIAPWAEYVHLPADRDAGRTASYYAPVRRLDVRRLVLGVVDHHGDKARTEDLIAAAIEGSGRPFALATPCGLAPVGERPSAGPTVEELLRLHSQYATPVR